MRFSALMLLVCGTGAALWAADVQGIAPVPGRLFFVQVAGAAVPAAQDLTVPGPVGAPFTIVSGASWLKTSTNSGTAPAVIHVSVQTTSLAAGAYASTLTITSSGSTVTARVDLAVTPATGTWSNPFQDVATNNDFFEHIVLLRTFGVTIGCNVDPPQYCPDQNVTRAQMAAFLTRSVYGESFSYSTTPVYSDVPKTHIHFAYVQKAAENGLIPPCGTGKYCPDVPLLRSDMAVGLVKTLFGDAFAASQSPYFSDIPPSHPDFRYVQKLREIGTTIGCAVDQYCPDTPVTRWQMAGFLARQFFAWKAIPVSGRPQIGNCNLFPPDNAWNTRIDNLPVHANSANYVNTIGATSRAHADFGSGLWDGGPIGIPYVVVPGTQPKVPVSFYYGDESDPGPYPIPSDAPIEGGPQSGGDRHVLVVDRAMCKLYEVYDSHPQGTAWAAGSGAVFDLNSNALRPAGWTSADAAGLAMLPGLVRYDEVAAGEVLHAIRFTAPQTQNRYIWPARHQASSRSGANYPPMGLRFRLKASFDVSSYSPECQVILRALKKFGMILADNGASWYLGGVPDERWNNDHLAEFGRLRGSDFEAVDTSSMQIDDTARARQP